MNGKNDIHNEKQILIMSYELKIFLGNKKQIERKFKKWIDRNPLKEILFVTQSESRGWNCKSRDWDFENITISILYQVKNKGDQGGPGIRQGRSEITRKRKINMFKGKLQDRQTIINKTVKAAGAMPCAICAKKSETVVSFVPKDCKHFGCKPDQAVYTPLCQRCSLDNLNLDFLEATLKHSGLKRTVEG